MNALSKSEPARSRQPSESMKLLEGVALDARATFF